jgi:hypothetical protein
MARPPTFAGLWANRFEEQKPSKYAGAYKFLLRARKSNKRLNVL